MITKITSRKVELPPIYLIENEDDFKELPKGLPYIVGTKDELRFITVFLEFQVLYRSCMKTGLPIKWLDCLMRIGYGGSGMRKYTLSSGGEYFHGGAGGRGEISVETFVEDQYLVNFDALSDLKILPKWLDDLRSSVEANVIDEVQFDPLAFNKQLGLNIGYGNVKHNLKNLLILDVSGSIPKSVVVTITHLAKLMSKKFYADVLITSGLSQLIDYDDVPKTDLVEVARKSGYQNESIMFREIIKETKEYNTVICFGDDDCPGTIDVKDVKFKVETLYSLHTSSSFALAGYSRCFSPKNTHNVTDWVKTLS